MFTTATAPPVRTDYLENRDSFCWFGLVGRVVLDVAIWSNFAFPQTANRLSLPPCLIKLCLLIHTHTHMRTKPDGDLRDYSCAPGGQFYGMISMV